MKSLQQKRAQWAKKLCTISADALYEKGAPIAEALGFSVNRDALEIDFFPPSWFLIQLPISRRDYLVADPFGSLLQNERPLLGVLRKLSSKEVRQVFTAPPSFADILILGKKKTPQQWIWKDWSFPLSPAAEKFLRDCEKESLKTFFALLAPLSAPTSPEKEELFFQETLQKLKNS